MCNKAIDNYPRALEFVSECRKMCDKTADTHPPTIKYVPECYKIQEMCNKAVHRFFLYFVLLLINIKLKKYVTWLFLYILL